jgi:NADPH:quinone reductase-like Zn-dependent oxidoreductase
VKAIVYTRYGPPEVLALREVEKPSPENGEVLVRVHAASVNALDWRPFTLPLFLVRIMRGGLREPADRSLGVDLAGRVEAVGPAVTRFRPGDEVFGMRRGAFAEYVCAGEDDLVLKPAELSFEAAAAVPVAALTALQSLRDKGGIEPGHEVLVHGAGGGVGTFAVQIAKSFGAQVTAVCGPQNLDTVRSIGADHVIDYTREDFTTRGRRYDLIIAANGYHSVFRYRQALEPGGTCVVLGGAMKQILQAHLLGPVLSRLGNRRIVAMMTRGRQQDLAFVSELLQTGKIVPVIDRRYALADTAEAIAYLVRGHARGKVVLTV